MNQHYLPHGFLFELISCPHYFGEVLIYLGIAILLQFYLNALIILLWTFCIHIAMALQSHNWYRTQFGKTYPQNRKAFIPFLL